MNEWMNSEGQMLDFIHFTKQPSSCRCLTLRCNPV
jgi:hypothetical protein